MIKIAFSAFELPSPDFQYHIAHLIFLKQYQACSKSSSPVWKLTWRFSAVVFPPYSRSSNAFYQECLRPTNNPIPTPPTRQAEDNSHQQRPTKSSRTDTSERRRVGSKTKGSKGSSTGKVSWTRSTEAYPSVGAKVVMGFPISMSMANRKRVVTLARWRWAISRSGRIWTRAMRIVGKINTRAWVSRIPRGLYEK